MTYPDIDPIAISIGPIAIHWYGLMYLLGFIAAYLWLEGFDAPVPAVDRVHRDGYINQPFFAKGRCQFVIVVVVHRLALGKMLRPLKSRALCG